MSGGINGDRNAIARAAFNAGVGQRRALVGIDGKPLNKGVPFRVAIIVVSQGPMVYTDFAIALASLTFNPGAMIALANFKCEPGMGNLSMAYNNAIETAKPLGVDYYFFVSPDIIVPQHALRHLLSRQVDIVGAAYMRASQEQGLAVAPLDDVPMVDTQDPMVKVRAIPPGCLLVKASVFEKLRRPYFRADAIEEDIEHGVMPSIIPEWVGFGDHARASGFDVWMDAELTMQVGRSGEAVFRLPQIEAPAQQEPANAAASA